MARTTNRPSTATRPNAATAPSDTNGSGSFDEQDQRGEGGRLGDNTERRENLTSVRDEPDNERGDSRENRDDERGNRNGRDDRAFGENRDERTPRDGDAEQGSRREQSPTLSAGLDAYAPVLEAWKQVFKSWSELAETMVKAQQDAFASMIGAANTTAKNINVGDRRNGELAFSGSRTTASTPDRIEHDRR
jgi:hypothetical protein